MFTIIVSQAELDVVSLALGRPLEPKPVRERRAAAPKAPRPYRPRLPRLSDAQFSAVTSGWAEACEDPTAWRLRLAGDAGRGTFYLYGTPRAIAQAWGLDPETLK